MKRRVSRCLGCRHRERAQIDLGIARHISMVALSRRFKLSTDCLYRHAHHISPALRATLLAGPEISLDLEKLKADESQSLLGNLVALRQRLWGALDEAETYRDVGRIAKVASVLTQNFELVAKLLGDLNTGTTVTNNILVSASFVEVRSELLRALMPYPDAKRAVATALHKLESKAAETIELKSKQGYAS